LIRISNKIFFILLVCFANTLAGTLSNITITPSQTTAGAQAVYTFTFTTDPSSQYIPQKGKFVFTFAPNFNVSQIYSVSFGDPLLGGFVSPIIKNKATGEHIVICQRDSMAVGNINPGTTLIIYLEMVGNPTSPSVLDTVRIETYGNVDIETKPYIDAGSAHVNIYGPIVSFQLSNPTGVIAGTLFSLSLQPGSAVDGNGNPADGIIAVSAVSGGGPADDGTQASLQDIVVSSGSGSANQTLYKAEPGVILRGTSSTNSTDDTDAFIVSHAAVDTLVLTGTPSTLNAGAPFPDTVKVTAKDAYLNVVTNYTGSVYFTSTDPRAELPFTSSNKTTLDAGKKSFPGGGFILKTAGDQTITITDDTDSTISNIIQVTKGVLFSFKLTASNSAIAGQPFTVNVDSARDAAGNLIDATVGLSFEDGEDHIAPDGTAPVLHNINVVNGSGSTQIYLYSAENNLVIKAISNGITRTSAFDVFPGQFNEIKITELPDTTIAGNNFNSDIGVDKGPFVIFYDSWGNKKTNFSGLMYFSTSDQNSEVKLQYTLNNQFNFPASEGGDKKFDGDYFKLITAGTQTIKAHSGSVVSEPFKIMVLPGPVNGYELYLDVTPVAGVAFPLKVRNAFDEYGNKASETIEISASQGGNNAPNGQAPFLNDIIVTNGSGSANQTLVRTEQVVLQGRSSVNKVVRLALPTPPTGSYTVQPGALGRLTIEGYPTNTNSNVPFQDSVKVKVFDTYGNDKTNYTGTISFSTTDTSSLVVLPSPYEFPGNTNKAAFAGNLFRLVTPGAQRIKVADAADTTKNATTNPIAVNAISIEAIYTDVDSVSRSQTDVQVTMQVKNSSTLPFTVNSAGLRFYDGNPRNSDYFVSRADAISDIPDEGTRQFHFKVTVRDTAKLGDVIVDGFISGEYGGGTILSDTSAATTDTWKVCRKANLVINTIVISPDTVNQGQTGITIQSTVSNNAGVSDPVAVAKITSTGFSFLKNNSDSSSYFHVMPPNPGNSLTVPGGSSAVLSYNLDIAEDAPVGIIQVANAIMYYDANIKNITNPWAATALDTLITRKSAKIQLVSITTSQPTLTAGQDSAWQVYLKVKNVGKSPLEVKFNSSKTFIKFTKLGQDLTSKFTIEPPTVLREGGTVIDPDSLRTLEFIVNKTWSETGNYAIMGGVEATNGFFDSSLLSSIVGSFTVQTPDDVRIVTIVSSQPTATKDDLTHPWFVNVVVKNFGESQVDIDFQNTALNLSNPAGFIVEPPDSLTINGPSLPGLQTDTLKYRISQTGSFVGTITLESTVRFTVSNTGAKKVINTAPAARGQVEIQTPANFHITDIRSSRRYITAGTAPEWWITVVAANSGGADVQVNLDNPDSTWIKFYKGGTPQAGFPFTLPAVFSGSGNRVLKGGKTDSLIFPMTQAGQVLGDLTVHARLKAIEINRGLDVTRTTFQDQVPDVVTIQSTANVSYVLNSLLPKVVSRGSYVEFQVTFLNSGESPLTLQPLQTTFKFTDGSRTYSSTLDESFSGVVAGGGSTALHFRGATVDQLTTIGSYNPTVTLVGQVNGTPYQNQIQLSNQVTVTEPSELTITAVTPEVNGVTAGQTTPWGIDIGLSSHGSTTLKLDSARVWFYRDSDPVSQFFQVDVPDTLANGTVYLPKNSTGSLPVRVLSVSPSTPTGRVSIAAQVWMSDSLQPSKQLTAQTSAGNLGYITVQAPAQLQVTRIRPSQSSVTRGQAEDWSVAVHLANEGGSDLQVKTSVDKTHLKFNKGNQYFTINQPAVLEGSGNLLLRANSQDSLRFTIANTGNNPQLLGSNLINALITAAEVNSGAEHVVDTESISLHSDVTIQDSAKVRIDLLVANIPNKNFVNTNQEFYLKAKITNVGNGDAIKQATIAFASQQGFSTFPTGQQATISSLGPGSSAWTEPGVRVKAASTAKPSETFTVRIASAVARNTNNTAAIVPVLAADDSTVTMHIQQPGNLIVNKVTTSEDTIKTGRVTPWYIYEVVSNSGQGSLVLTEPDPKNDISFTKEGYVVEVDTVLSEDGLLLTGGDTDTLVYAVTTTGPRGGEVQITAVVWATDLNDTTKTTQKTGQATIFVTTSAAVSITNTFVDPQGYHVDASGTAFVNTGQRFDVTVRVKNEGGRDLDSVRVKLRASKSILQQQELLLTNLATAKSKDAIFHVTADNTENANGEVFTAAVKYAYGNDGSKAEIHSAADSTVLVKIQKRAELQIVSTQNLAPNAGRTVSFNQSFPVKVEVKNNGSEDANNVQVKLTSSSDVLAAVTQPVRAFQKPLAGGKSDTLMFNIQAKAAAGTVGFKSTLQGATGANDRQPVAIDEPGDNDSTFAIVQQGASLAILDVLTSVEEINAGDAQKDWRVNVVVQNSGGADVQFQPPKAENLVFRVNDQIDDGYQVRPPASLKISKNLELPGGKIDTLVYVISENGWMAGEAQIEVTLTAFDKNKGSGNEQIIRTGTGSLIVISTARVKIVQTVISSNLRDPTGAYLVNGSQVFQVRVTLETGERSGVEAVEVALVSNGNSFTETIFNRIDTIPADSRIESVFTVTADTSRRHVAKDLVETFTASVVSAKALGTELAAQILTPKEGDDKARARIQLPAQLAFDLRLAAAADSNLTAGQEFNVIVDIRNRGTAPTDSGYVTIIPPPGYEIEVDMPERKPFIFDLDVKQVAVAFTLISPTSNSTGDSIKAVLSHIPQDLNAKQQVPVDRQSAAVRVSTISSLLAISTFNISAPAGAIDGRISTSQDFKISTSIIASANITGLTATLTAPAGKEYIIFGDASVPLTDIIRQGQTYNVEWDVKAPETPDENHEFKLHVEGLDSDGPVFDDSTLVVQQVVRQAELELEDLTVSEPQGLAQNGQAVFSAGQNATLRTRVVNTGVAGTVNVGRVKLELFSSGLTSQDPLEKDFAIDQIIEWKVIAPDREISASNIRVSVIVVPRDENSNKSVQIINSPNELTVSTVNKGWARVESVWISSPLGAQDNTVSTGQNFQIRAEISSDRLQEPFKARVFFSDSFIDAAVREKELNVGQNQPVTWDVTANEWSEDITETDSVWVEVSAKDKQSSSAITATSKRFAITIEPQTEFWLDPSITFPEGLVDRVSTDQRFNLTAALRHQGAAYIQSDSFTIELIRPSDLEYKVEESLRQTVGADATWHLQAPSEVSSQSPLSKFLFRFVNWPRDINSGLPANLRSNSAELTLHTVNKARLVLTGALNAVDGSPEGNVRVGNRFDVFAAFQNLGDARFEGEFKAAIKLPKGYRNTLADTLTSTSDNIRWTLIAPDTVYAEEDSIKLFLIEPPDDQYSKQPAAGEKANAHVIVRAEEGMVLVKAFKIPSSSAVDKGKKDVAVLGLELKNRDSSVASRSILRMLELTMRNKQGKKESPQSYISRIAVVKHGDPSKILAQSVDFTSVANNMLLNFTAFSPDTIIGSRSDSIEIRVDVSPTAQNLAFQVMVDSASAFHLFDSATNHRLVVGDSTMTRVRELNLTSGVHVVIDPVLNKTFFNYPNPFGTSSRPITKFLYFLEKSSDVTITIYTLTGEMVKSWNYTKADHPRETQEGLHDGHITWDGTNGQGGKVMNGVYLAYINTDYGESAVTKIAVIK
jgi:hypothetical protein